MDNWIELRPFQNNTWPESNVKVLVCSRKQEVNIMHYSNVSNQWYFGTREVGEFGDLDIVQWWMPLPKHIIDK
jgi:hypothetical protein